MRRILLGLAAALATLLTVLSAFSSPAHASSIAPAPFAPGVFVGGALSSSTPPGSSAVAPSELGPSAVILPGIESASTGLSPASEAAVAASTTPSPHWSSGDFRKDIKVTFSVPGMSTPPSIAYVPFNSTVPFHAVGFYMNISTDVPITAATLNIWSTQWPGGVTGAPVSGFDPTTAANPGGNPSPMVIGKQDNRTASFYFDDIAFFWPGNTIAFNLEVDSAYASPSKIWSNQSINVTEKFPNGFILYPSWEVDVLGPFASPNFQSDFAVSTDPNVLSIPPYDPNPGQKLLVTLTSVSSTGGPALPIPDALIQYTVQTTVKGFGTSNSSYSGSFGPENSTIMRFQFPQPFPGDRIFFNITTRLPWSGAFIDSVVSPEYSFNWSSQGGWWYPSDPLETNMQFFATPNVLVPGISHLPTGTRVNLTIHEPIQNVTIGTSEVNYQLTDRGATYLGTLRLLRIDQNTSFVVLPGLPPNASLTFSVTAKDYFNNPVTSSNYTYAENGSLTNPPPFGEGLFFVEVYDVGAHTLVGVANYTVQNSTWSQNATTSPMGYGALSAYGSSTYVFLSDGVYILTLHVFGQTILRTVTISTNEPFTVVYYVSSTPVSTQASSPQPSTLQVGGVLGLAAGAMSSYPILRWYKERRARAEAEQRRVTL